ncbi:cell wall-active antibiotics response protein LiaF [Rossellomorea sp. BNER]|uniref:cell wall-active antibiotics response protein LiaF n=1 Tax=Rossellomorea sp. BNER TaxID=2962031 RepID=UPI003AF26A6D|nr:cell wall-active antibiotics response protein LiaF [Rossellomorea sp. BNER]
MKSNGRRQWFFSTFLLLIGVTLLLINIGVISMEIKEIIVSILPILLVFLGLKWLFDSFRYRSIGKMVAGLFVGMLGGLKILDQFQLLAFSYSDWWRLWPVFIIAIAFQGIFLKKKMRINIASNYDDEKTVLKNKIKSQTKRTNIRNYHNVFIGEMKFKDPNWPLEPMSLHNGIGNYYFDLSKAYIPEGETPILIKGWIGDLKMLIPEDVAVEIDVNVSIGEIRLFDRKSSEVSPQYYYRSPDYDEANKRIRMSISLKIGSVRVRHV